MQVSEEIFNYWKENLSYGDKGKMGLSAPTIWKAFSKREASPGTIQKINEFFKKKKESLEVQA